LQTSPPAETGPPPSGVEGTCCLTALL
jgi:hypothetical protein